jgi:gamma-glutamyl phosphate reductase
MTAHTNLKKIAHEAKKAAFAMATSSLKQRNDALKTLVANLHKHREAIFQANRLDRDHAQANGIEPPLM